ncbi:MAG TPA: DUF4193 family protein [Actinomycetota bacterium]|nr:DUF4193 family protein [Actinomycetota bacterium]
MSVNEIDEPGEDEEDDEEDVPLAAEEEASFDEFLSKAAKETTDSEEEEETLLDLTREERLESLSIRAAPKQPNEFVCTSCRLVKHESQLADAKRELCRDCV